MTAAREKVTRRSWSRVEKSRIVEEAYQPGSSVAEVARKHGLNANQVFNWRRRALAATGAATVVSCGDMASAQSTGFLPVGMIVHSNDDATTLVPPPAKSTGGGAVTERSTAPPPAPDDRPGVIEIDLACGTRLRVDAFVNERALRRVMSVLKASS